VCEDAVVPRLLPTSPLALALLAYRVWRRLPAAQRRRFLAAAVVYAPRLWARAQLLRRSRRRGAPGAVRDF
jgi:MoxR-like ATPase